MAEKVNKGDFIELDYTGKLSDGSIFDTTSEKTAKEHGLFNEKTKFKPASICVGEGQILPGLDKHLEGHEISQSFMVNLKPEEAFGKKDIKKLKMVPASTFKEHNVQPQPGLQIDVDGEMGTIARVAGGRIMVNFNHPLAGKEVKYEVIINKKISEPKEKILAFLNTTLRVPVDKLKVEIKEETAEVEIPFQLPPQFTSALSDKLTGLVGLKSITLKTSKQAEGEHIHSPNCSH